MGAQLFLVERMQTLKPVYEPASPFYLLRLLSTRQWLFLLIGFLAWAWDGFDYFSITQILPDLNKEFGKSDIDTSLGFTISLAPRFVGAAAFGIAADLYGRKWTFVVNIVFLSIMEMAIPFCQTYAQFLVCRTLFGLGMGGLYGNATATALEDCPEESRGLVSGMFQSGYSLGYLLSVAFYLCFYDTVNNWKPLFWFGASVPVLLIIFRLCLPETTCFLEGTTRNHRRGNIQSFASEAKEALRRHWRLLTYLILFMSGCSFLSHGSEDIFPLMLREKYNDPVEEVTVIQVVANLGALLGSLVVGLGSQIVGRRFAIIVACILGGTLAYPYSCVSGPGIYALVFLEQFFIQGIFGVVPIHLIELSPPAFRTFVVGTAYNLGIAVASPIPLIETYIGQRFPIEEFPEIRYDYRKGMAIFLGCAFAYTIIITFLGPENRKRAFLDDESESDEPDNHVLGVSEIGNGRL